MNRLLIHLYTNDYPEEAIASEQQPIKDSESSNLPHLQASLSPTSWMVEASLPPSRMMSNTLVYAIADKYDLPRLKALSAARVQKLATKPSSYTETTDLALVARTIFESTPASDTFLRSVIIGLCVAHIDEILKDSAMTDVMQEVGSLGLGIMLKAREKDRHELESVKTSEAILQVDLSHSKAEESRKAKQKLATERELIKIITTKDAALNTAIGAKNVAITALRAAVSDKDFAITQKVLAVQEKNQIISERDAAMNETCNCLPRLDYLLSQTHKWSYCRNCGSGFDSYLECFGTDDHNFNMQLRCKTCRCRHEIGTGVN